RSIAFSPSCGRLIWDGGRRCRWCRWWRWWRFGTILGGEGPPFQTGTRRVRCRTWLTMTLLALRRVTPTTPRLRRAGHAIVLRVCTIRAVLLRIGFTGLRMGNAPSTAHKADEQRKHRAQCRGPASKGKACSWPLLEGPPLCVEFNHDLAPGT